MKKTLNLFFVTVLAAILLAGSSQAFAQTQVAPSSTPSPSAETERERIETIVHDYLLKNPAIIREAMLALQVKEERDRQELAAKNLRAVESNLYEDAEAPVAGNPKADISIVVFFDYNCGYCKKTLPDLESLLAKDPLIRIIYKEFPILGPESEVAARAALAADRQGKYAAFHHELILAGQLDTLAIKNISQRLGLDYLKLQKDMADPKIADILARNMKLAASLEINGTPGYVVGEQIIPGAIDMNSLAKIVSEERAKLAKAKSAVANAESQK